MKQFQFTLFVLILLFPFFHVSAQSISGNLNSSGAMNLSYANVDIYKGDKLVANVLTDLNGNYKVHLDTGMYRVEFQYAGFEKVVEEIRVTSDEELTKSLAEDRESEYFRSADEREKKRKEAKMATKSMSTHRLDEVSEVPLGYSHFDSDAIVPEPRLAKDYISTEAMRTFEGGMVVKNREGEQAEAGKLTAGEINDFSKWDLWNDLKEGELSSYQATWKIAPNNRFSVQVVNNNRQPIANAQVHLLNAAGKIVYRAVSDNTGKAELWSVLGFEETFDSSHSIQVKYKGDTKNIRRAKSFQQGINTVSFKADCDLNYDVDISFVVDATGSMSDELNFLKAELNEVIYQSKQIDQRLNFRFSNIFYRDLNEDYLTVRQNFSRVLSESITFISDQNAAGGGDFPEAMDVALEEAIQNLDWNLEARARLLFVILDAPPHNNPQVQEKLKKTMAKAAEKGIRIIPLVASGISKDAEYLMRSIALATNGTYAFLTDHSGIGNGHLEPSTDEYEVELLSDLLIRVITNFTYQPDCEEEMPTFDLDLPDSLVVYDKPIISDSTEVSDSLNPDFPDREVQVSWRYWPNPTNGIVNIEVDRDVQELMITDMTGKLLIRLENLTKGRAVQVDLSSYSTGIYLIRYPVGKQWISGKVILMKN